MFANLSADWVAHNPAPAKPTSLTWRTLEAGLRMDGSWPNTFFGMIGSYASAMKSAAPEPSSWVDASWPVAMLASVSEHGAFLSRYCDEGNPNW